jgi:hypothetical protein
VHPARQALAAQAAITHHRTAPDVDVRRCVIIVISILFPWFFNFLPMSHAARLSRQDGHRSPLRRFHTTDFHLIDIGRRFELL